MELAVKTDGLRPNILKKSIVQIMFPFTPTPWYSDADSLMDTASVNSRTKASIY